MPQSIPTPAGYPQKGQKSHLFVKEDPRSTSSPPLAEPRKQIESQQAYIHRLVKITFGRGGDTFLQLTFGTGVPPGPHLLASYSFQNSAAAWDGRQPLRSFSV
jgi:hypothetical protein